MASVLPALAARARVLIARLSGASGQKALLSSARRNLAAQRPEAALADVEAVLAVNPRASRALQLRGRALILLGRRDEAIAAARATLEIYPLDPEAPKQLMSLGIAPPQRSLDTALDYIRKRGGRSGHYVEGARYLHDGRFYQEAIWLCDEALAAVADGPMPGERDRHNLDMLRHHKALALEAVGEHEAAQDIYQGLLENMQLKEKAAAGLLRSTRRSLLSSAKRNLAAWRLDAALADVDQVLAVDPRASRALHLRGRVLILLGRRDEAIAAARATLAIYPLDLEARKQLMSLGIAPPQHSLDTALDYIRSRGNGSGHFVQGALYLYNGGLFRDAIRLCDEALAAVADGPTPSERDRQNLDTLLHHKALALESLDEHEAALALYQALLDRNHLQPKAAAGIARCSLSLGKPDVAITALRSAGSATGEDPFPFTPLHFEALLDLGDIQGAYRLYRKKPVSRAIAEAFAKPDPMDLHLLNDDTLARSALVIAEGGPGDELRMAQIYPEIAERFRAATFTCDPRLLTILQRSFPALRFLPTPRTRRELARDLSDRRSLPNERLYQCLNDEALRFGQTVDYVFSVLDSLADIRPNRGSFLNARSRRLTPDPKLAADWKRQMPADRPQIGLAWRSMLQSVARDRHYLQATDLDRLADVDADFWILQPKASTEELDHLARHLSLRIPEGLDLVDDLEGQLAIVCMLDCVVSPFTTTAELGGAAGTPTLMLSTLYSTRWRDAGERDIWHPAARVVSGTPSWDRKSMMARVASALADLPARHGARTGAAARPGRISGTASPAPAAHDQDPAAGRDAHRSDRSG